MFSLHRPRDLEESSSNKTAKAIGICLRTQSHRLKTTTRNFLFMLEKKHFKKKLIKVNCAIVEFFFPPRHFTIKVLNRKFLCWSGENHFVEYISRVDKRKITSHLWKLCNKFMRHDFHGNSRRSLQPLERNAKM